MGRPDRGQGRRYPGDRRALGRSAETRPWEAAGMSKSYWMDMQSRYGGGGADMDWQRQEYARRDAEERARVAAEQAAAQQAAEQAAADQAAAAEQAAAEQAAADQAAADQAAADQAAADQAAAQQAAAEEAARVAEQQRLSAIEEQRRKDAEDAAQQRAAEEARQQAAAEEAAELGLAQTHGTALTALDRPAPGLSRFKGYTPMDYDVSKTGSLTDMYARMLNVPYAQPFMEQTSIPRPDSFIPGTTPDTSIFGIPSLMPTYEFNPTTQTSFNPYSAADGGRVGKMSGGMGGMMIIEDNDVVNNGMGAILNKYKQIRSEL